MIARDDALSAFESDRFDMVVIGGGITGAGVALDASTRGYSVALVESQDYAAGTSSRSSKLVHGGLRYLQNFDLGLVREALLERALLVNLAPHLVRPLELLIPAFEGKSLDRALGIGLNAYDVMATERIRLPSLRRRRDREPVPALEEWSPERHRVIEAEEVVRLLPALESREPTSAFLFYDCQTDDVRLVLTVLGEAERFGTVMANRCRVVELIKENGRADGVRVRDEVGGREFEVRADNVVNATGVWADTIGSEEVLDAAEVPRIRPSRGTHITLSRASLPLVAGAIVPAGEGRSIFALPWLGRSLIGTTDNDYEGGLDHIPADDGDVEYLLTRVQQLLRPLAHERGPHRRVRGRAAADRDRRLEEVRRHLAARRAVRDPLRARHDHRRQAHDLAPDGEARRRPDRGARGPRGAVPDARDPARRALRRPPGARGRGRRSRSRCSPHRYGYAAHDVLALAEERPELARRIVPDLPDLLVEAPFAARNEQAQSVADVLLRRTRLGILAAPALTAPDSEPAARGGRGAGRRSSAGTPRGSTASSRPGARWRAPSAST